MPPDTFDEDVFVNCPFDSKYKSTLFPAIVFAIYDCGFRVRSALEVDDATVDRLDKIFNIIKSSKYGVHDISMTQLDPKTKLPRFNMPLELGIFLAAQKYGGRKQANKNCLILDKDRYRYHKFISDISGKDPKPHDNKVDKVIKRVRDWLNSDKPVAIMLPGDKLILERYKKFKKELPDAARRIGLNPKDLQLIDLSHFVVGWVKRNPKEDWIKKRRKK
ncbi:MAG: hypothetical protein V3T62_09795 [Alphaproteobacteria bacterium]